jgi:uncharacterized protein YwgA
LVEPNDISLLIAVIGLHKSEVRGRTRIQKEMCILKHRDKVPIGFEFSSYYYGPYSTELTDALDTLIAAGLLKQSTFRIDLDICRYDYSLTKQGKELFLSVLKMLKKHHPKLIKNLRASVSKLQKMTMPDIISLAKLCSGMNSKPPL